MKIKDLRNYGNLPTLPEVPVDLSRPLEACIIIGPKMPAADIDALKQHCLNKGWKEDVDFVIIGDGKEVPLDLKSIKPALKGRHVKRGFIYSHGYVDGENHVVYGGGRDDNTITLDIMEILSPYCDALDVFSCMCGQIGKTIENDPEIQERLVNINGEADIILHSDPHFFTLTFMNINTIKLLLDTDYKTTNRAIVSALHNPETIVTINLQPAGTYTYDCTRRKIKTPTTRSGMSIESQLKANLLQYDESLELQSLNSIITPQHLQQYKNNALVIAIERNNDDDVVGFIDVGANPDTMLDKGKTVLMFVANRTWDDTDELDEKVIVPLQRLLQGNANILATDDIGFTALIYATLQDNCAAILLLNHFQLMKELAYTQPEAAETLYESILKSTAISDLLISYQDIQGEQYPNPLLRKTATPNGDHAIHVAALHNCSESIGVLSFLDSSLINAPNNLGRTPLHLAAQTGSEKALVMLLKHPDIEINHPDNQGFTPLDAALLRNQIPCAATLISSGGKTVLQPRTRAYLLDSNASKGIEVLCELAKSGKIYAMRTLLETLPDIDVNHPNATGKTPLCLAASSGGYHAVKYLVEECGANGFTYKAPQNVNCTPLHFAACNQTDVRATEYIVQLMQDSGLSIDEPNSRGETPLTMAIRNEKFENACMLLERGAIITQDVKEALTTRAGKLFLVDCEFRNPEMYQRIQDEVPELFTKAHISAETSSISIDSSSISSDSDYESSDDELMPENAIIRVTNKKDILTTKIQNDLLYSILEQCIGKPKLPEYLEISIPEGATQKDIQKAMNALNVEGYKTTVDPVKLVLPINSVQSFIDMMKSGCVELQVFANRKILSDIDYHIVNSLESNHGKLPELLVIPVPKECGAQDVEPFIKELELDGFFIYHQPDNTILLDKKALQSLITSKKSELKTVLEPIPEQSVVNQVISEEIPATTPNNTTTVNAIITEKIKSYIQKDVSETLTALFSISSTTTPTSMEITLPEQLSMNNRDRIYDALDELGAKQYRVERIGNQYTIKLSQNDIIAINSKTHEKDEPFLFL